jgi:hypothetical protein
MEVAHWVLLRQLMVCWQQAFTMHWLQGVPPGSRGQLPLSIGTPQWPPLQVRPVQHWGELVQLEPCGRQLPSPQMLAVHRSLQHSLG